MRNAATLHMRVAGVRVPAQMQVSIQYGAAPFGSCLRPKPLRHTRRDGRFEKCASLHRDEEIVYRGCQFCRGSAPAALGIPQQSLESEIHVVLNVAMEQRRTRLIRGEIHDSPAIGRDHNGVLNDA